MFSWFTSKKTTPTKSSAGSANSFPSNSRAPTSFPPSATDEYDDVTLENGVRDDSTANSRASFSAPSASRGDFVGMSENLNSSMAENSYPPLPSFTRPSSTNGYPPLKLTFNKLEEILADQAPNLLDSLAAPLLPSDPALLSLQDSILPYRLPPAVLESYALHDGQDPFSGGGTAPGLFFGLYWMAADQVEQEWKFWRRFEDAGGRTNFQEAFSANLDSAKARQRTRTHPYIQEEGMSEGSADDAATYGMSSFPQGWVRKRYSHPGWIPLLTDRCGNYIGVDLDPPPHVPSTSSHASGGTTGRGYGQPGQVIAFGREIDEKIVLFPGDGQSGWGRFLAAFVEDVERSEFARLGEGSRQNKSAAKGWDEESGRELSPDSFEWDGGDGLGERSYFESERYGEEGDETAASPMGQSWVLRSEFRRLLSEDSGGLIGLIAQRSRKKWKSLGVGTTRTNLNSSSVNSQPGLKQPLKIFVPANPEAGPPSAATVRAEDYNQGNHKGKQVDDTTSNSPPSNVELVLQPPSPKLTRHENLPDEPSRASSQYTTPHTSPDRLNQTQSPKQAERSRNYLAEPARRAGPNKARRKIPPPAPQSIDLPTLLDLRHGHEPNHALSYNSHSQDEFVTTTPKMTSSQFGRGDSTPTRDSLLPTHTSPNQPNFIRADSSRSNLGQMGLNGSTTALVTAADGVHDSEATKSNLNSPEEERAEIQIHVQTEAQDPISRSTSPLDQPYQSQTSP